MNNNEVKPTQRPGNGSPNLSIGANGALGIGKLAFDKLGQPALVKLMLDPGRHTILIEKTEVTLGNVFPVGTTQSGFKRVSAAILKQLEMGVYIPIDDTGTLFQWVPYHESIKQTPHGR